MTTNKSERLYQVEVPGSYMIVNWDDKPHRFFQEWKSGEAVITDEIRKAMVFSFVEMAEHVADQLGDGWRVLDVGPAEIAKAKKLLEAIFREDNDERLN